MDFEIYNIDRGTCTLNKIYSRRFVKETLSTNLKRLDKQSRTCKSAKLRFS